MLKLDVSISLFIAVMISSLMLSVSVINSARAQVVIDLSELEPQQSEQNAPASSAQRSEDAEDGEYIAPTQSYVDYYFSSMMKSTPYRPARFIAKNRNEIIEGCGPLIQASTTARTAQQVNYRSPYWEERISSDWQVLSSPGQSDTDVIALIDFAHTERDELAFRYLSNGTQDAIVDPQNSAATLALSAALAQANRNGVSANSLLDTTSVATHISEIYRHSDSASALANYFVNFAQRGFINSLLRERWLLLHHPRVHFSGAFGNESTFMPAANHWVELESDQLFSPLMPSDAIADPSYAPDNCPHCGKTGHIAMTPLALAESLKRLITHQRVPQTALPALISPDINTLLYGHAHTKLMQGMVGGSGRLLHAALAQAMAGQPVSNPKRTLDSATRGHWRIYQHLSWAESATRNQGEAVLLAHVCLPHYQGGREFSVFAKTTHPLEDAPSIHHAGIKLQRLLARSFSKLLTAQ